MTLTELALYLEKLFPGRAPTRAQLYKASLGGVFSVIRTPYSPVAKKCHLDVPEAEVEKVVALCQKGGFTA